MKVKETTRKKRRKQTAEVFTPTPLVNEMLKKIPKKVLMDKTKTFLDNSCGNGQFLVQILKMKLGLKHTPEEALSTIFGVDLMEDNINECRMRMINVLKEHTEVTNKHLCILIKNTVCYNGLEYDYEFNKPDKEYLKEHISYLKKFI